MKLTPNVTSISDIAAAVEEAGADAVSLINTLTGMRINIETRRPVLRNNTGGMSGPAVFPVAVRMVWETARRVKIPVIGMGGIASWEDAVEMMLAGASAIQVGHRNVCGCVCAAENDRRHRAVSGGASDPIGHRTNGEGRSMVDTEHVKLIIVRHCEAMGNHHRVFQGSTDCDITENGARQLDALAERMLEFPFQAAYSSPLQRALKTAQAANRHYGLEIKLDARLAEIHRRMLGREEVG